MPIDFRALEPHAAPAVARYPAVVSERQAARLLLVVDRDEAAGAYAAALRRARDVAHAGTVSSLAGLAGAVERLDPAVVLVDVAGDVADPFRAIASLRESRPDLAVVVVHGRENAASVRAARECGARGFVLGCLGPQAALASVRAVLADGFEQSVWSRQHGSA